MTAAAPAARAAPPRLTVQGLRKAYGARQALHDLGFSVQPGEIFGLLGPNGAGKSTAFRILAGLEAADAGTVALDVRADSPADPRYRARLGVVFQDPSVDVKLTGRENLALGAALYGLGRGDAAARISAALAEAELGARADEPVARYSGGMRRRLEIARVLLHDPDLLLLDEPGRGVDPEALRRIWDGIAELARRRGLAAVVTTHQADEAERCHRVAVLDGGRVVATGSPEELRARLPGDVVTIEGDAPEEIAATLRGALGVAPRIVGGIVGGGVVGSAGSAVVAFEAPRGHELVPRVVALFPAGRLRSLSTARPTLADLFASLTGRALDAAAGGDADAHANAHGNAGATPAAEAKKQRGRR
jgi:ABC-2 type transport system ATP-binding protein